MATRPWTDFFDEEFLSRLERLRLVAKYATSRSRAGARRTRRVGDGLEFADHRAYAPGDDPRFIDWPYFARMERLLLRLFHEHSEADVGILLDCSASMAPGGRTEKFNSARRAAAALAYVAMAGGERVTMAAFADELRPTIRTARSRGQIFRLLDRLAELRPGGPTKLLACVEQFVRRREPVSTALLISDLLDCRDELGDALARLKSACSSVCVLHTYSPPDAAPSLAGPLLLEQAETRGRLGLNVSDDVLSRYRSRWRHFAELCRRTCMSRGALYVPAPTDVPMDRGILAALRQAGVLQG
ncbi:MAG TPA: DUF58 domain-containing protein [Phycisphaerae bacterium]|nr:DUF58 domain-containing protein [Phycisphaerae bacterium]HUT61153.1 DUF58 domain-containing protein [Phycisphaerae bacterium]